MDARPAGGFAGGNIPGSINLPMPSLYTAEGTLKPISEVRELFVSAGVALDQPVVFTCGGGVMATVLDQVAEAAGIAQHKVYDGSWSEYSQRSK